MREGGAAVAKGKKKYTLLDWEDWYLLACRYAEEHGDLLVPRAYVCPTGELLGRWVERQRAKHNRVASMRGHMEPWQAEMLERIGMVWKLEYRRDWAEWMERLDEYSAAHGNLDIPHDYSHGGYHLGNWLVKQRQYYAAGELTDAEVADLEARGVNWSLRTRRRAWDDWYADAAAYYREHGNLMVHLDYRTPGGCKLGFWIYRQRDVYMGRKKGLSLSESQIERLNAIGMVWAPLERRKAPPGADITPGILSAGLAQAPSPRAEA